MDYMDKLLPFNSPSLMHMATTAMPPIPNRLPCSRVGRPLLLWCMMLSSPFFGTLVRSGRNETPGRTYATESVNYNHLLASR